jgi:hypothetical protein
MNISVLEASNYFRGLLVLIRIDGKVNRTERTLVLRAGKCLGFQESFCRNAINEILENTFVDVSPPRFASQIVAGMFIRDCLLLSQAEGIPTRAEESWIRAAATKNGFSKAWCDHHLRNAYAWVKQDGTLETERVTHVTY